MQTHQNLQDELRGTSAHEHAALAAAPRIRLRAAHYKRAPRAEARLGSRELQHSGERASNSDGCAGDSHIHSNMIDCAARTAPCLRLATCAVVPAQPHVSAVSLLDLRIELLRLCLPRAAPSVLLLQLALCALELGLQLVRAFVCFAQLLRVVARGWIGLGVRLQPLLELEQSGSPPR